MSYASYTYLLFFLVPVFVLYTAFPKRVKWVVLLAASYIFYLVNSGVLLILLIITTAAVFLTGRFLNRIQDGFDLVKKSLEKEERRALKAVITKQKRTVIAVALIFIFGMLGFLKYCNFFGDILNSTFFVFGLTLKIPSFKLLLPLGISYYTLQAASYIIDVYRGKYRASENPFKVALFLSFFPQIVEGPICRFDLLADSLYEGHRFDYDNFTQGLQLIFWGLLKKLVIADRANILVCSVFENYKQYSGSLILIAGVMYTVQIYAEFSGCMDIVTGSAQLFSVPLSKNFERPFFSRSVNEFWRRWHITLGAWLRDYVFYSISLSKRFAVLSKFTKKHFSEFFGTLLPTAFALFFVWLCNGIWHGAGFKYICYGMYYYLIMLCGMLLEPLFAKTAALLRVNRDSSFFNIFATLRTCAIVTVGMMLFRSESVGAWIYSLKTVFTDFNAASLNVESLYGLGVDIKDLIVILVSVLTVFTVSLIQEKGIDIRPSLAKRNIVLRWAVYIVLIMSVVIFGAYGAGYETVDFIYGQF